MADESIHLFKQLTADQAKELTEAVEAYNAALRRLREHLAHHRPDLNEDEAITVLLKIKETENVIYETGDEVLVFAQTLILLMIEYAKQDFIAGLQGQLLPLPNNTRFVQLGELTHFTDVESGVNQLALEIMTSLTKKQPQH